MKENSRQLYIVLAVVCIAIAAIAAYMSSRPSDVVVPPTQPPQASTTPVVTHPNIDTKNWKEYSNPELGFAFQYPADLQTIKSTEPQSVKLSFPKTYFTTVLKDDVTLTASASTTCVRLGDMGRNGESVPRNITYGTHTYTFNEGMDAAAGNIYTIATYDMYRSGTCYSFLLFIHGANGAGLYESDPALIESINATHATELKHVRDIVDVIIASFTYLETPTGVPEDTIPKPQ